jgi:transposase
VVLFAAIDIHKQVFQAAVLDPDTGDLVEERFSADRESLDRWAEKWRGRVESIAVEATTGWRWVWRELTARGFEVRLAESQYLAPSPPSPTHKPTISRIPSTVTPTTV